MRNPKVLVGLSLLGALACSDDRSTIATGAPGGAPGSDAASSGATNGTGRPALDLGGATIGSLPESWVVAATAQDGPLATWEVVAESGGGRVLALVRPNHSAGQTFNLCWNPTLRFRDGALSVRLRADAGVEDQGGGLIWRAMGPADYYVARFNPLESNLRVYFVKGGKREQLGSADVAGQVGAWYTLSIRHVGDHIECSLDGKKLLDVRDATFPDVGGVGLWTKADAATSFDQLTIAAEPAER